MDVDSDPVKVLFHSTVFGPIRSRRLGVSLGINLSPDDGKVCSFDCLYCEAGFNNQGAGTTGFPSVAKVERDLEAKLKEMQVKGEKPDVITFSGNGEPTLHPRFPEIIDRVIALRNKYFPAASISVLTNSTMLHDEAVVEALKKVENPILKLDSAVDSTIRRLDRPNSPSFTFNRVREQLKAFGSDGIIQTMLVRGRSGDEVIDNTTPEEVKALIDAITYINPRMVMLYSIDRPTPDKTLVKVSKDEMEAIARRLREAGIKEVNVA